MCNLVSPGHSSQEIQVEFRTTENSLAASRVCDLYECPEVCIQKGLVLGLMLTCHNHEILNSKTRSLCCHFALGPANIVPQSYFPLLNPTPDMSRNPLGWVSQMSMRPLSNLLCACFISFLSCSPTDTVALTCGCPWGPAGRVPCPLESPEA